MLAIVTPETIQLPSGSLVRLPGSWENYRALIEQLGDRQTPRIKYRHQEILLMSPLPKHGRQANLIADIVKVLLDYLEQDYEAFTPITMELPEESGIEPDYCFYIDRWEAIAGKARIDWSKEPPPDLVIEIDVTSYTDINDYLPYTVPEIWLLKNNQLTIYSWQGGGYTVQSTSRYFPKINISEIVGECLQIAGDRNTSTAIRQLRKKFAHPE